MNECSVFSTTSSNTFEFGATSPHAQYANPMEQKAPSRNRWNGETLVAFEARFDQRYWLLCVTDCKNSRGKHSLNWVNWANHHQLNRFKGVSEVDIYKKRLKRMGYNRSRMWLIGISAEHWYSSRTLPCASSRRIFSIIILEIDSSLP